MVKIKRGLFIGINYTGTSNALRGCINDQENLTEFFINKDILEKKELVLMNDFKTGDLYPTKVNILKQIDTLVEFCNNNQDNEILLVFAYSGHGSFIRDKNGDEEDHKDEVLCPIDCDLGNFISDDIIKQDLVDKLGKNVKLVMFMDCCHSGTIVDLKYNYKIDNKDTCTVYGTFNDSKCKVVSISGCLDKQTSADAYMRDKRQFEFQGAMTSSFLNSYSDNISYKELINKMRNLLLEGNFQQIPQLSTSFSINTADKFLLSESLPDKVIDDKSSCCKCS